MPADLSLLQLDDCIHLSVALFESAVEACRALPCMDLKKWEPGFWGSFAKKAKEILLEDGIPQESVWTKDGAGDEKHLQSALTKQHLSRPSQNSKQKLQGTPSQKGRGTIASSLSLISGTLGNAIEEGLNLIASDTKGVIPDSKISVKEADNLNSSNCYQRTVELDSDTQLKASRDVAMAMAEKVKLLQRELKSAKTNLAFMDARCLQLEEENRKLRESLADGIRHGEDDLVRAQLETLVAEKSRLAQENASYARENRFLHEVIEYHRLRFQDGTFLDERMVEEAAEVLREQDVKDEVTQDDGKVVIKNG